MYINLNEEHWLVLLWKLWRSKIIGELIESCFNVMLEHLKLKKISNRTNRNAKLPCHTTNLVLSLNQRQVKVKVPKKGFRML